VIEVNENVVFSLAQDKSPAEVTLRSTDWAVITQIDGHKTVAEIASILALTMEEAVVHFTWLYDKGLLKYVSSDMGGEKVLPPVIFEKLENELMQILGPVAPYVIDDVLWTMEVKRSDFKLNKLAELIESISDEIEDEDKKLIFQQKMLLLIQETNTL